jgi:hypothetical protein
MDIDLHNTIIINNDVMMVVAMAIDNEANPTAHLLKDSQKNFEKGAHFTKRTPKSYLKMAMTRLAKERRIIQAENTYIRICQAGRLRSTVFALPKYCSRPPLFDFSSDIFHSLMTTHGFQKEDPSTDTHGSKPGQYALLQEADSSEGHDEEVPELGDIRNWQFPQMQQPFLVRHQQIRSDLNSLGSQNTPQYRTDITTPWAVGPQFHRNHKLIQKSPSSTHTQLPAIKMDANNTTTRTPPTQYSSCLFPDNMLFN